MKQALKSISTIVLNKPVARNAKNILISFLIALTSQLDALDTCKREMTTFTFIDNYLVIVIDNICTCFINTVNKFVTLYMPTHVRARIHTLQKMIVTGNGMGFSPPSSDQTDLQ